jgi:hypothetical protein
MKNLKGKKFGKLTVRDWVGKTVRGYLWECSCKCGKTTVVRVDRLISGKTKSCGCLSNKRGPVTVPSESHGQCKDGKLSPEYVSYHHAKDRCNNPNTRKYSIYGGRGIEFRFKSFKQFIDELGPRPKGTTLDRKEGNGHYEPGNVRWATPREQGQNRRKFALGCPPSPPSAEETAKEVFA